MAQSVPEKVKAVAMTAPGKTEMGHLMTAACRHHEVSGQDNFLSVARKAGDFLDAR